MALEAEKFYLRASIVVDHAIDDSATSLIPGHGRPLCMRNKAHVTSPQRHIQENSASYARGRTALIYQLTADTATLSKTVHRRTCMTPTYE